jgi:malate synthase
LWVAAVLDRFVADELLQGLALTADEFWRAMASLLEEFGPRNEALLRQRQELQRQVDHWHAKHAGTGDLGAYEAFLAQIGYLEPPVQDVRINVEDVDSEIASIAGPQLVVPLANSRYTLNAANARWGSLYDALYGTDAVPEDDGCARTTSYNARRGARVMASANGLLNQCFPLVRGDFDALLRIDVMGDRPYELVLELPDGPTRLLDPSGFRAFRRDGDQLRVLLSHHDLGVQLVVDRSHPIGSQHLAGIADVVLEAAVTTIADCEDSVAAIDADDKVVVYRNWLGLMNGLLAAEFSKNGRAVRRELARHETFTAADGSTLRCPSRALLLVRNVGLHMMTDSVLLPDGALAPEGLIDALVTVTAALHDRPRHGAYGNSASGSIYVVKPKLHGSAEVAFTVDSLERIEELLGLRANAIKLGIMDEERRTSLNLDACIAAARNRVIFVNTGFLDRTGDEIHTMRTAGPVVQKEAMRDAPWFTAYEDRNVQCGLAAGFAGHAQIGKGMWASPDKMAAMLASKVSQLRAGASCAWVPSPTAATLHALHYHLVDVTATQRALRDQPLVARSELLRLPILESRPPEEDLLAELRNNAQGILGYVVRWVHQGIGCSKVPDIRGEALMEDRATLRISSQHVANWLRHGIVDEALVRKTFVEMAKVVDQQNADDSDYTPMSPDLEDSLALRAALELVFDGLESPNGYTEDVLHRWRRIAKSRVTA